MQPPLSDQPSQSSSSFGLPAGSPSAPPVKKSSLLKWVGIGLGVFAVLCVALLAIGALFGPSEAETKAQAAAQTATQTALAEADRKLEASATEQVNETFDSNESGFDLTTGDNSSASIGGGAMNVSYSGSGTRSIFLKQALTNFVAEVDCTAVKGGSDARCGLIFAVNGKDGSKDNDQYWFYVAGNSYGVETKAGSFSKSFSYSNSAIKADEGATNHLKVVRVNNEIRLYVNEKPLDRYSDDKLTSGGVGFQTGSQSASGGVEVKLDNFKVAKLP